MRIGRPAVEFSCLLAAPGVPTRSATFTSRTPPKRRWTWCGTPHIPVLRRCLSPTAPISRRIAGPYQLPTLRWSPNIGLPSTPDPVQPRDRRRDLLHLRGLGRRQRRNVHRSRTTRHRTGRIHSIMMRTAPAAHDGSAEHEVLRPPAPMRPSLATICIFGAAYHLAGPDWHAPLHPQRAGIQQQQRRRGEISGRGQGKSRRPSVCTSPAMGQFHGLDREEQQLDRDRNMGYCSGRQRQRTMTLRFVCTRPTRSRKVFRGLYPGKQWPSQTGTYEFTV